MLLGIDIGTSSTKSLLIDERGRVLAAASSPHPIHRDKPLWSEQEPEDWWRAVVASVREVIARASIDASHIRAVGLSGQMHGAVLLDKSAATGGGHSAPVLRRAILWNDQRCGEQCDTIERAAGGRRKLVEMVGNAALPGFTLPKLMWVRDHEPAVWGKTHVVVLPKDYIRLRLTAAIATDAAEATGMLAQDIDRRAWNLDLLSRVGIDPAVLPPVLEACEVSGTITSWAADQTGLRAGTPVVGGSGDNQTGAVGAGAIREGLVLATLGTSGVIYSHTSKPRKDLPTGDAPAGRLHAFCAGTGTATSRQGWCVTGVMLSAAGSLQWLHDTLFPDKSFDDLMSMAASVPPGSEGLVFMPQLTGERCPYPDPRASGGWIGLSARHTAPHLVRSVIEGVTFTMGQILGIVRSAGIEVRAIRIGGGAAKSSLWRQIQADVYAMPVALPNTEEGPALGAAIMAGVGAGAWTSVQEACGAIIKDQLVVEPGPDLSRYQSSREVHASLYPSLRAAMHQLAGA
ncbi:MAG: xylulokinase [Phycisphaerales bacterium]|nr:xylulokinase [Phycisphaerales bacterium]